MSIVDGRLHASAVLSVFGMKVTFAWFVTSLRNLTECLAEEHV